MNILGSLEDALSNMWPIYYQPHILTQIITSTVQPFLSKESKHGECLITQQIYGKTPKLVETTLKHHEYFLNANKDITRTNHLNN